MTPPKLPELEALERIIELGAGKLVTRVACEVKMPKGDAYPVHVIAHLAEMHALKSIFCADQQPPPLHHRTPKPTVFCTRRSVGPFIHAILHLGATHFLPLTLEMGSWLWVKKNPRQLLSRHGMFNPLIEHRQERVLRQHQLLLDFLSHAACAHALWLPKPDTRASHHAQALQDWY